MHTYWALIQMLSQRSRIDLQIPGIQLMLKQKTTLDFL